MLRFRKHESDFWCGNDIVWLAAASWGERNIDFQSVRPAGLQPADWGQRRTSPLGTQAKGLCSARRITQPCSLAAKRNISDFCLVSWKKIPEILRSAQDDNFIMGYWRLESDVPRRFELRAAYVSIFVMTVEPRREVAIPLIDGTAIFPKDAAPSTVGAPTIEQETDTEEALDVPWQVVVHNDPVNLMSYVTMVFQRVFGYPRDKAEKHMLEVHQQGRSILWSGMRERAELYVQQLHGYLLLATLEKTG